MSGATILVTLVALVVRLVLWGMQPGLTYDGTYYLRQAERLFHGGYELIGFPPGYPFVVLLLRFVVGDFELAGRLTSLLASVAMVAFFHVWARRSLPAWSALTGALVLALHPEMVRSGVEILSEPLYLFCIVTGLFLFSEGRDLPAAGLLGYAFLVRPEAFVLLCGCVVWRFWKRRPQPRFPVSFVVVALIPVVLYSTLASRAAGHWVLSPKQGQLDLGGIFGDPLWLTVKSLHALFPLILLPVALLQGWRDRMLALTGVLYLAIIPLFDVHIQPRLMQPALPFLLLLSLAWIETLRRPSRFLVLGLAAGSLLWGAAPVFSTLMHPGGVTPFDRRLGESLRQHLQFEDRVACRFPFVPYYAGAGFARVPLASYLTTMDSLQALGATHLLLVEYEVQGMIPQLRPLFDDAHFATAEGRLEMVQAVTLPEGPRALLYRFQPPPISLARSPVVHEAIDSAAWSGATLLCTGSDGRLHRIDSSGVETTSPELARLEGLREIRASDDGQRLACTVESAEGLVLADLDVSTSTLRLHPSTLQDSPHSPCWVGHSILYVARTGDPGLRVLDVESGARRSVLYSGVDRSEATPLYVTSRGRDLATTYVRPQAEATGTRIVATALWPEPTPPADPVVLQGRWAVQLSLADDAIAWVPGADRLVGSAAIREIGEDGQPLHSFASLAVFQAGGDMRTLSYGVPTPIRPTPAAERMAFISEGGALRIVALAADQVQIPRVRVFEGVREGLIPRPN